MGRLIVTSPQHSRDGWRRYAARLREYREQRSRERIARLLERVAAELERIRLRGTA